GPAGRPPPPGAKPGALEAPGNILRVRAVLVVGVRWLTDPYPARSGSSDHRQCLPTGLEGHRGLRHDVTASTCATGRPRHRRAGSGRRRPQPLGRPSCPSRDCSEFARGVSVTGGPTVSVRGASHALATAVRTTDPEAPSAPGPDASKGLPPWDRGARRALPAL